MEKKKNVQRKKLSANVKATSKEKEAPGKESKEIKEPKNNKFQKPPSFENNSQDELPSKEKKIKVLLYFLLSFCSLKIIILDYR